MNYVAKAWGIFFMFFFHAFSLNFEFTVEDKIQKFVRCVYFLFISLLVASVIDYDSEKINWIAVLKWKFSPSFDYQIHSIRLVSYWVFFCVL